MPSLRGHGPFMAAVAAAFVLVACGTTTTSNGPSSPPSGRATASSPVSSVSSVPASPAVTDTPGSPAPSVTASTQPTNDPTAPSPATSCSGTAENRDFFATVAGLVAWDVYCGVVPDGWYIESGRWRLKDGGRLDVTYHGPNGARIVLVEGVFCADGAGACGPMDQHLGTAGFGDREGNLGELGGNLVLYVNAGARPAWQATANGLDQPTFVGLAAALFRVGHQSPTP